MHIHNKYRKKIALLVVFIVLFSINCQLFVSRHPAERAVRKMYKAFSAGDMNAYLDTILPENRKQPNIFGLLNAITIGIGPVGIDFSKLTAMDFSDLEISLVESSDNYALVQAEGKIRYPILMLELQFCDQHDVRLHSDGEWYVDVYAPERIERLERILDIRQQEILDLSDGSETYSDYDLFEDYLFGLEQALNLCE